MPYINCPDGHTYRRYDDSPYVVWCIENEDSLYQANYHACSLDPKCAAEREAKQTTAVWVIGIGGSLYCLIILWVMIGLIRLVAKTK